MVDIRAKIYDGLTQLGPKILTGIKLGTNVFALDVVLRGSDGTIQDLLDTNNNVKIGAWDSNEDNVAVIPKKTAFTFHDLVIANGDGEIFENPGFNKLTIYISKASVTTCQIDFKASINGTTYVNIYGLSNNNSFNNKTTENSIVETWVIDDISGYNYIKLPLSNLTGTGATVLLIGEFTG